MADYVPCRRGERCSPSDSRGAVRPYNFVCHGTNYTIYPEDPEKIQDGTLEPFQHEPEAASLWQV
ncbi:MAG: hypothetical protein HLUCCO16_11705 [Phormidium sp. OSCR]|nr:MAG: hypothetical protein HLUCCO16_11705 [Phormidium sp. OSCR]